MPDLPALALRHLVTVDNTRGLLVHLTVVMIDEPCERFAVSRLASLQDELLLARHCHDAEPVVVGRLEAEVAALSKCLDAAVRNLNVFIDARLPGLSRSSQRIAAVSAERASTSVLAALRALLDSESVVRSGHARNSLRVSDGSAKTAQRVNTVLTEIDRAEHDHRSVVAWLRHEQDGTVIHAARRLHRRAAATAAIDNLALRAEARGQVA